MKKHATTVNVLLVLAALGPFVLPCIASAETASHVESKPTPRGHGPARYEDRILWLDEAHERALFLPHAATVNRAPGDLPINRYERNVLEDDLELYRKPDRKFSCRPAPKAAGQGARADATTLEELVVSGEVAFVGTVVRTVPGWSPWMTDVVTAAYIEVDELIHGDGVEGVPEVGSVAVILYVGGATVVEGTGLCADVSTEFPIPLVGDRVLLAGRPWAPDANLFYDYARFPVVDGEVRPEPRYDLKADEKPRPLDSLVRNVRVEVRQRGRQWTAMRSK